MELWNDFEGKTVDGRFQLDHLIGPKGRSAYFTTRDEAGAPAEIRLIESLNDEDEILSRWRMVRGLKEEHLLDVLACGQTVLDGTHLVYAVMEPTDAELADVLRERPLTVDETRQIALSVAGGLEILHAKGMVHAHVEAENVLAKGETIKLRSDVAREAPEGAEGVAMRAKDVRDLSLLLSYCLTQSRRFGETRLPVPFDEVVRKGESGAWGLNSIVSALRPIPPAGRVPAQAGSPAAATRGPQVAAPARGGAVAPPNVAAAGPEASPVMPVRGSGVAGGAAAGAGVASAVPATVASRLANQGAGAGDGVAAHLRSPRGAPDRISVEPDTEPKRTGLLAAIAVGVLLLVVLGIYFFRSSKAGVSRSAAQDTPSAVTVPEQSSENRPAAHDAASAPVPQVADRPLPAEGTAHAGSSPTPRVATGGPAAGEGGKWRVVAFTYNRESQAADKARAIAARHPELKPEVYTPSGRAPYLVALGGWMSADQASALRRKARSEGMPRDVYMRNYRGSR